MKEAVESHVDDHHDDDGHAHEHAHEHKKRSVDDIKEATEKADGKFKPRSRRKTLKTDLFICHRNNKIHATSFYILLE